MWRGASTQFATRKELTLGEHYGSQRNVVRPALLFPVPLLRKRDGFEVALVLSASASIAAVLHIVIAGGHMNHAVARIHCDRGLLRSIPNLPIPDSQSSALIDSGHSASDQAGVHRRWWARCCCWCCCSLDSHKVSNLEPRQLITPASTVWILGSGNDSIALFKPLILDHLMTG